MFSSTGCILLKTNVFVLNFSSLLILPSHSPVCLELSRSQGNPGLFYSEQSHLHFRPLIVWGFENLVWTLSVM